MAGAYWVASSGTRVMGAPEAKTSAAAEDKGAIHQPNGVLADGRKIAGVLCERVRGADLVGMSTVPEVIAANHMGVKTLAISCVTNMAAGILNQVINHEEVLETGERVKTQFVALLRAVIPRMARDLSTDEHR